MKRLVGRPKTKTKMTAGLFESLRCSTQMSGFSSRRNTFSLSLSLRGELKTYTDADSNRAGRAASLFSRLGEASAWFPPASASVSLIARNAELTFSCSFADRNHRCLKGDPKLHGHVENMEINTSVCVCVCVCNMPGICNREARPPRRGHLKLMMNNWRAECERAVSI